MGLIKFNFKFNEILFYFFRHLEQHQACELAG